jgi:hypothetical protein
MQGILFDTSGNPQGNPGVALIGAIAGPVTDGATGVFLLVKQ